MTSAPNPDAEPRPPLSCPECASGDITVTLKTTPGFYCRCRYCGYIWHCEDRQPQQR